MKRTAGAVFLLLLPSVLSGGVIGFSPREFGIYVGGGKSPMNRRGHSVFHSIHFELSGRSSLVEKWLPATDVGASVTYSDVRQARSWFGYRDGDPDDSVRAESLYIFGRHYFSAHGRTSAYLEVGTGPMWSNRRVPAATSRLNFDSQLGLGLVLFRDRRFPLYAGYRFSHISNGGLTKRNPGLNVSSFIAGTHVALPHR